MRALRSWLASPQNRPLLAAAAVGLTLRSGWALWATNSPGNRYNDAWAYAGMAKGFAKLQTPVLGGVPTAFFPPGYPLATTPLVWIGKQTGLWNAYAAGSILNVGLSTISIILVGLITRRFFGATAGLVSSWVLALSPTHIFYSSANLSESLLTLLALIVMAGTLVLVDRNDFEDWRGPLLIGITVGFAVLVKSSALVLLLMPALTARARSLSWQRARQLSSWTLLGAVLALGPWLTRNIVEVGVWTPLSTNNAAFVCNGNRDGATGGWDTSKAADDDCFVGSPFDSPVIDVDTPLPARGGNPDEARWYRETTAKTTSWVVSHPFAALQLVPRKVALTYTGPGEALKDGRNQVTDTIGGPTVSQALKAAATWWHFSVLSLAALGILILRSCRRAYPVWGYIASITVVVAGGIGLPRYHHSITAVATILVGAVIAEAIKSPPADETTLAAGGQVS